MTGMVGQSIHEYFYVNVKQPLQWVERLDVLHVYDGLERDLFLRIALSSGYA